MKKQSNIELPNFKLEDFYTTQEQRESDSKEKIENIEISLIEEFNNHPFKVIENEELKKLEESIKLNGVLEPIIVRKMNNGKYEIVSGHRRKRASELIGNTFIPCIIRNMTDDEATIYMVDSNIHREYLLPSEKSKAYKMKLDALNHQGQKTKATCGPMVHKLKTRDIIGEEAGESGRQVQRYIRLNFLIPKLLDLVDNSVLGISPSIALRPAVEISYLKSEEQSLLLEVIEYLDVTPSHAQSIELKKISGEMPLTENLIHHLMSKEKSNQVQKIKISEKKLRNMIPENIKINNIEEFVMNAVEFYGKYLKDQKISNE